MKASQSGWQLGYGKGCKWVCVPGVAHGINANSSQRAILIVRSVRGFVELRTALENVAKHSTDPHARAEAQKVLDAESADFNDQISHAL